MNEIKENNIIFLITRVFRNFSLLKIIHNREIKIYINFIL